MITRRPFLWGMTVLALVGLAGCSGRGSETSTTIGGSMKEWSILLDRATAPHGSVHLQMRNEGHEVHELIVVRTDLAPDALPMKGDRVDEDQLKSMGEIQEFSGGKVEGKTFDLSAGKYVLFCNIPGHYQQGMRTGFTVT